MASTSIATLAAMVGAEISKNVEMRYAKGALVRTVRAATS
jgi:hypothetical protein